LERVRRDYRMLLGTSGLPASPLIGREADFDVSGAAR
jgi:hypothetical protein